MPAHRDYTQKILIRFLLISAMLALVSGVILYCLIYHEDQETPRKAVPQGDGDRQGQSGQPIWRYKGDDELVNLAADHERYVHADCSSPRKRSISKTWRDSKTLEQLRHTEKLSTVGQIAAGIAHEIGTPLNVVDGRAKMIISEHLEREEIIGCAKIIKSQAERMTLIIRQLLDFSRKKKDIMRASENVVTLIAPGFSSPDPHRHANRESACFLKVAPEVKVSCLIDGQQIQQVFMNVIMNGIQATPDKGSVQVDVANIHLKSMLHTDDQMKEFLRIDISDEGQGIAAENLQKIFTPFFTTKSVGLGTGLGLSIAQELLEEHGGWIEVDNRQPKGQSFHCILDWRKAA